ncbi:phiSA1p31-related protein [Streptomyces albipurpureus]|uniref:PhiSA1p31-related protein n=1 Tax=Streptomyces albipurpureus TaxID=2897419 RepID=A0ABT0UT20_9ACTN|nr:phiSA1p31-related protein [Streptomyces sp. CWNU-1]MCM2391744.1 phiSA1p31-related protein [Streptomyces sp. CWNU-1]
MTTFKVGDRVRYEARKGAAKYGVVTYGPYRSMHGNATYLVRLDGDNRWEWVLSGDTLKAVRSVAVGDSLTLSGTRHTVEAGPFRGVDDTDDWFVLKRDSGHEMRTASELEQASDHRRARTYEHNGVTYDLTAKYLDSERDVWSFTGRTDPDGTPRVTMTDHVDNRDTVAEIANVWGPLIKV